MSSYSYSSYSYYKCKMKDRASKNTQTPTHTIPYDGYSTSQACNADICEHILPQWVM